MAGPSLVAASDVTSPDGANSIFDKAVERFGKVDVLINAAGHMNQGEVVSDIEPADWWKDFVSINATNQTPWLY